MFIFLIFYCCIHIASAVDQLKTMVSRRQYREVAQLLQATTELSLNFGTFKNVRQINDLLEQVQNIHVDLKRMIFGDFEGRCVCVCVCVSIVDDG